MDIQARDTIGPIVSLADEYGHLLNKEQQETLKEMLTYVQKWQGSFDQHSIGASIYSVWQAEFLASLFSKQVPDLEDRVTIFSNYAFQDFFTRLMLGIRKNPEDPHFNKVCEQGFKEYKGTTPCAYNIARAFVETKSTLVQQLSPRSSDWEWRNLHLNEYFSAPWSLTVLKPFFQRDVPAGGNGNTVLCSKYSVEKAVKLKNFRGIHGTTFRQLQNVHQDNLYGNQLYSVESG